MKPAVDQQTIPLYKNLYCFRKDTPGKLEQERYNYGENCMCTPDQFMRLNTQILKYYC